MFDEKIMELELAGRTLKVSTGKISIDKHQLLASL